MKKHVLIGIVLVSFLASCGWDSPTMTQEPQKTTLQTKTEDLSLSTIPLSLYGTWRGDVYDGSYYNAVTVVIKRSGSTSTYNYKYLGITCVNNLSLNLKSTSQYIFTESKVSGSCLEGEVKLEPQSNGTVKYTWLKSDGTIGGGIGFLSKAL